MLTINQQSVSALMIAIHAAQASRCEDVGLSANRKRTEDGYDWDVYFGVADPYDMTIIDSVDGYIGKSADEIAAVILNCWDAEWDD